MARKIIFYTMLMLLLTSMLTVSYAATNQPTNAQSEEVFNLNEAESFVLQAVSEGKSADLIKTFGDNEDARKIRAQFLHLLLINGCSDDRVTTNGVTIIGAIINGPLQIINNNIGINISFYKCKFNSYINFYGTKFDGYLQFADNCSFFDDVYLNSINVRDCLVLNDAIFYRTLNLTGANIEGEFAANSLHCKNTDLAISFHGINVGKSASFKNAEFNGGVDFTNAKIGIDLLADDVKFQSKNLKILFDGLAINGCFSLGSARCDSQASFMGMDIGMAFNANNAEFKNINPIFFTLMRTKAVILNGVYFEGPVDFTSANISEMLVINAQIDNKTNKKTTFKRGVSFNLASVKYLMAIQTKFEGQVSFKNLQVSEGASFNESHFYGPVDFLSASFGGYLSLDGAYFLDKEGMVNLNSIKISGNANFINTEFHGPVDFTGMDVDGALQLCEVKFLNQSKEISFDKITIEKIGSFWKTIFKGGVSFYSAYFKEDLSLQGAHFEHTDLSADFRYLRVGQNIFLNSSVFQGMVSFANLNLGGSFIGNDENDATKFLGYADFEDADVGQNMILEQALFNGGANFSNADIRGLFNFSTGKFPAACRERNCWFCLLIPRCLRRGSLLPTMQNF